MKDWHSRGYHPQPVAPSIAKKSSGEFQTPIPVCEYMASLIPFGTETILEPTAGKGNLLSVLKGFEVTAPEDYFLWYKENPESRFDCIIMNPPFSARYAELENAPAGFEKHGMKLGYHILTQCMEMTDRVIALMPWFTLSDSDVRLRYLKRYGMKSVSALPRKTFAYTRIQTCVIELIRGYRAPIEFRVFDWPKADKSQMKLFPL